MNVLFDHLHDGTYRWVKLTEEWRKLKKSLEKYEHLLQIHWMLPITARGDQHQNRTDCKRRARRERWKVRVLLLLKRMDKWVDVNQSGCRFPFINDQIVILQT